MEIIYGLATWNKTDKEVTGSDWQLKCLLELSDEKYEQCIQACTVMEIYRKDAQLFQLVLWNHQDYCDLLEEYLEAFTQKNFESWSLRPPNLNLNRCMMNLLSSVRGYLDQTETSVKRKYGSSSSNIERFKQYCSEAYDNSFSYRFLYKFRNYAQHCGLPLTKVGFSAQVGDNNPEESHYILDISIDRDELLTNDFDWGKLKPEISEQPSIININNHIDEMMNQLKDIHSSYIADEFISLKESATYIKNLLLNISDAFDELHLFKAIGNATNRPHDKVNLKMRAIPLDLISDVFDERFAVLLRRNNIKLE